MVSLHTLDPSLKYTMLLARPWFFLVWISLSLAPQSLFAGPEVATVKQIWEIATIRQEKIKNIKVDYDVQWKELANVPSLEDGVFDPFRIVFAYDGDRRYLKWTPTMPGQAETTSVFDGKYSLIYSSGGAIVENTKDPRTERFEMYVTRFLQIPLTDEDIIDRDSNWFYPHCVRELRQSDVDQMAVQEPTAELAEDDQKNVPAVGESLYHLVPGGGRVDGAPCLLLENIIGLDRIWVDPRLDYAMRKRERRVLGSNDELSVESELILKNYAEVGDGIFLPMECEYTRFGTGRDPLKWEGRPILVMSVSVNTIELNEVSDGDFAVELPAGTTVATESETFVLPGVDTHILEEFSEVGKAAFEDWEMKKRHGARWMWIALNACFIAVLLMLFFIRFRRARS